ncbi:nuclear export mediator factor NEMF homolog isoform X1 [Ctenocephalides felis]|uniref:nuclear export mediator factor NEMF homolog isoform X1 n=1 Tax=Ctenocephalides felis TaxID=7515 RepID=UPI000E6E3C08|nr:nuclear export mediator factor NEMF homolog isoform X1 [Ctenocephalides felis]
MKQRFNTYDIVCSVTELQRLIGMRVNQVYDIDNKTYLIKLQRTEEKCVLLLESGNRFHTTAFEWPKNVAPSGFSMKMRKHLKNKRLESLKQLGMDRIIDLQFGSGEAAYHVILELYDRGNIILTDYQMTILNILRPHTEGEAIRLAVRETYSVERVRNHNGAPTLEELKEIFKKAQPGDNLRRVLNPHLVYGPAILDHVLISKNLSHLKIKGQQKSKDNSKKNKGKEKESKTKDKKNQKKGKAFDKVENENIEPEPNKEEFNEKCIQENTSLEDNDPNIFNIDRDVVNLHEALLLAEELLQKAKESVSKGYIIQKEEMKSTQNSEDNIYYSNQEYHPFLFKQHETGPYKELLSFDVCVDEFYSALEGQKIDLKAMQQEREALKKLSNVKTDHEKRLRELESTQEMDKHRAELITRNQQLVDDAILAVQTALANQVPWPEIQSLLKTAQANNDPIASSIKQLKLESNHISMILLDPYTEFMSDDSDVDAEENTNELPKKMIVDIDLGLSAYANARRYYDQKRNAAKKQQKTIESQGKALKSAEKKTKQTLKEVQMMTTISKARKVMWFEKFYWFISSENYLVIGGRDQQQNELIVKRYLRGSDVYVHADIQGASSIVIKNNSDDPIPPKTLNEAGVMAIAYSVAWDAKVVTAAWWVHSNQVSKTAPTGEYLTTGSFMIRGKKNYLPPCQMAMGLSFLFKLEDSSIDRHKGERRVRVLEDESNSKYLTAIPEHEIELSDGEGDSSQSEQDNCEKVSHEHVITEIQEEIVSVTKQFPDIQIKVDHNTGHVAIVNKDENIAFKQKCDMQEENVIYLGDDKPIVIKPSVKAKNKSGQKKSEKTKANIEENSENENMRKGGNQNVKRGQHGKLKKMKEKYKDQDEEERRLRMEILKSAGTAKEMKKSKKNMCKGSTDHSKIKQQATKNVQSNDIVTSFYQNKEFVQLEGEAEAQIGESNEQADRNERDSGELQLILDSLTGQPLEEDELLYAVPIIAPYNTLTTYKFKVKLTPGTGRRGKAAKTAVAMFVREKACTQREKDLIRAVKDDVLARNIPGKAKLSAPHLHKHK